MLKYKTLHTDPTPYRDEILKYWDEYLPGTNKRRFEWMKNNPAGPAHWFLAFEEKSGELSGVITVMPHHLFRDGRTIRAGIMGDFMVRAKDRVFGPGITLPKVAVSQFSEMSLDIIYTIPSPGLQNLMEKLGFKEGMVLRHMVKPLSTRHYLQKYLTIAAANCIAPICDTLAILLARETYSYGGRPAVEETSIDPSFDELWEGIRDRWHGIIGDHSGEYLQWRYFQNPQFKFRLITCRGCNNILLGYVFFSTREDKLEIYDILFIEESHALRLLRGLSALARKEGCRAMYLRITPNNPLSRLLRRCLFIDGRDDARVFFVRNGDISLDDWFFLSGDRNT